MIRTKASGAGVRNPRLVNARRKAREDNAAWIARNRPKGDGATLVMLGGRSPLAFRLRIAQGELRRDLGPSWWSHIGLLDPAGQQLSHIDLESSAGFGFPPLSNGVHTTPLKDYADVERWPNVAVLIAPVQAEQVQAAVQRFQSQRSTVDAVQLMLHWLGFLWGVGRSENPLHDGLGVPSAAMVEYCIGAAGYDLTPGLATSSACPEAIWQSAVWWHEHPRPASGDRAAGESGGLGGAYVADHSI